MFRALGDFIGGDGFVDMSFRETERWSSMPLKGQQTRVSDTPISSTGVTFGDPERGPVLVFLSLLPGVNPPDAPAHGHASDTWRMSLLGTLPMGPDSYAPGEFRFQKGWKPYASDNYAHGEDGGWTVLLFGDRRGMRVRPVKGGDDGPSPLDQALAGWLAVDGDLVSDDDGVAPGPSSFETTLTDGPSGARVNGSFADSDQWTPIPGGHCAASVLGTEEGGPVVLLAAMEAGAAAIGSCRFDAEVVRIVVDGSLDLDGRTYVAGDIRIQEAGAALPGGVAGPGGLKEVLIIADRTRAVPSGDDGTWSGPVHSLMQGIDDQPVAQGG